MQKSSIFMLLLILLSTLAGSAEALPIAYRSFDAYGHRVSLESPLGGEREYEHNHQGAQTTATIDGQPLVRDAVFGQNGVLESYVYDSMSAAPARRAEYSYDGLGRPLALSLQRIGHAGAADYLADGYGYDERGFVTAYQRSDRSVGAASVSFDYDFQGRLTSFSWGGRSLSYGYDPSGNLETRSGGLGTSAVGPFSYEAGNHRAGWFYDARGRLREDERFTYEYDERDRVRLVRERETGIWVAHYLYDASGRRVRVLEPDQVTYSYRDGEGGVLAEEVRGSDHEIAEQREHVTFGGRQVHTRTTLASGAVEQQAQFTDRLGNPVFSWSRKKETVHEYSPFGLALDVGAAQPHEGAFGFTGHEDDVSTGLTYMQARYYDAAAARFHRPDPARDVDPHLPSSYNLYQYAMNNPVHRIDPNGQQSEEADPSWHKFYKEASKGANLLFRIGDSLGLTNKYKMFKAAKNINDEKQFLEAEAEKMIEGYSRDLKDNKKLERLIAQAEKVGGIDPEALEFAANVARLFVQVRYSGQAEYDTIMAVANAIAEPLRKLSEDAMDVSPYVEEQNKLQNE
ncbi:MAG: hypothetical protein MPN21_26490 [Thermoanaerobaculia bacterium]|nr:hypothetical protein [Thermoanaerobaculia bacterium]